MAVADQPSPGPAGGDDPVQAALAEASQSLVRRGYLTTEWWTTIIGGALSAILALVNIKGSAAEQAIAVLSPALLAGLYAISRTMHKSAVASALGDVFPQAAQQQAGTGSANGQGGTLSAAAATAHSAAAAPVAQTDPQFHFEGIPPVQDQPNG